MRHLAHLFKICVGNRRTPGINHLPLAICDFLSGGKRRVAATIPTTQLKSSPGSVGITPVAMYDDIAANSSDVRQRIIIP